MGIDKDMLRLVFGRAIEWFSFHGCKGTVHLCIKTITIVKKSLACANSAQRYRSYAEIRRKIMLWDSCYHLRMFLQQQLVALFRGVLDTGKEQVIVIDHPAIGKFGDGNA